MDIEQLREYCLAKKAVTESTPFDQNTLVFKVKNKMFALFNIQNFISINLKCEPDVAIDLRERYGAVKPGYHMNKQHWNTICFHEDMPDHEIFTWVDRSYELIVASLPKKMQAELNAEK